MKMADSQLDDSNKTLVDILLHRKELSGGDFEALTDSLCSRTVHDL